MNRPAVLSVSELARKAKRLLEENFGLVWLEGEISNFAAPGSGHWYFSLKDESAQVRGTMFRMRNQLLSFKPKDGDKVLVRARVTLYEARGEFQLSVEYMEPAGYGRLQQQLELLKMRLAAEGLFDPGRKQAIPAHPKTLGLITSPSGAAVHDVLTVIARRAPGVRIIIYPALVQGNDAPASLISALQTANRRRECDVLLLTRGGGSFEDLFCFNDEKLCRAIAASELPLVSAVGHEVDFTLADAAADLRAPTPSAAAELMVPNEREVQRLVQQVGLRLQRALNQRLQQCANQIALLTQRLPTPTRLLENRQQKVDELQATLIRNMHDRLQSAAQQLIQQQHRLQIHSPERKLQNTRQQLQLIRQKLSLLIPKTIDGNRSRLQALAATLHAVSPLATLSRGYSVTRRASDHRLVQRQTRLLAGELLVTQLSGRRLFSTLTQDEIDRQYDELPNSTDSV